MKKLVLTALAAALSIGSLSSCSQRIGDFTMVTTKNYERQMQYKMVGRMEGKDMVGQIIGIPLGTPDLKNAVDDAIQAGNGVYLANAVISSSWWTAIVYGEMGYKVVGDVYAPVGQGDLQNPAIEKFELVPSGDGMAMRSTKNGSLIEVQSADALLQN
jgi:hypothetical protein